MSVRLHSPEMSSRHLPPPSAWKYPDDWLKVESEDVGYLRSDTHKFKLPEDDRGFIKPNESIELMNLLFVDGYEWPFERDDPETRPDIHHWMNEEEWYEARNFSGDTVPKRFRNLPPLLGRMPRQYHNTIHALTIPADVPDYHHMKAYLEAWTLAKQMFDGASGIQQARDAFISRREDVARNPERIRGRNFDIHGEEWLRENFSGNFKKYSDAIEQARNLYDGREYDLDEFIVIEKKMRPKRIIKELGRIVNRECINFVPQIARQAA